MEYVSCKIEIQTVTCFYLKHTGPRSAFTRIVPDWKNASTFKKICLVNPVGMKHKAASGDIIFFIVCFPRINGISLSPE